MFPRITVIGLAAAGLLALGCVTEVVEPANMAPARLPLILELPHGTPPAGVYHGVQLHFEVDEKDVPEAIEWIKSRDIRELPPIIPEIAPGGREIYRVRDVHQVEYMHNMFRVGGYTYPAKPNARLYVFKERKGNFSFAFRGQGIVVPSDIGWRPAIYYYAELESEGAPGARRRTKRIVREVVQVGLSRIETDPETGTWLVDGRTFVPDTSRPLELAGAIHAKVAR